MGNCEMFYSYSKVVCFIYFRLKFVIQDLFQMKFVCLSSLEISTIKQEREQKVARARRKATPVVGDMRPLADALPELSQLLPSLKHPAGIHRKNKR